MATSRVAVKLKRLRQRFGISAPRVAVRTQVAWYWRALKMIAILSVSLESHFGQSGTEEELREYYALTRQHMVGAAVQAWSMRRGS